MIFSCVAHTRHDSNPKANPKEPKREALVAGEVDKDDFLLLVGYCGWHSGQLQGELDRGDTWTMASVDPRSLLGQLRDEQVPSPGGPGERCPVLFPFQKNGEPRGTLRIFLRVP